MKSSTTKGKVLVIHSNNMTEAELSCFKKLFKQLFVARSSSVTDFQRNILLKVVKITKEDVIQSEYSGDCSQC